MLRRCLLGHSTAEPVSSLSDILSVDALVQQPKRPAASQTFSAAISSLAVANEAVSLAAEHVLSGTDACNTATFSECHL